MISTSKKQEGLQKNSKKLILGSVLLFGCIFPFVDAFVILQGLVFISPMIIFSYPAFILIVIFLGKKNRRNFILYFVLPFIAGQLIGPFVVDKVQRYRCDRIIKEREIAYIQNETYMVESIVNLGIAFKLLDHGEDFKLGYASGFLHYNEYYHNEGEWKRTGGFY